MNLYKSDSERKWVGLRLNQNKLKIIRTLILVKSKLQITLTPSVLL